MAKEWRVTISSVVPMGNVEIGRWPINLDMKQVEKEAYEELGLHAMRYLNTETLDVTLKAEKVNEVL